MKEKVKSAIENTRVILAIPFILTAGLILYVGNWIVGVDFEIS